MRKNISSNTHWEEKVGYSRAVRIGNQIEVAGTTAIDGDAIVGPGLMYEQARFIFQKIENALNEAGATLSDVIRTRMYVTDITQWEEAGRAHAEFFGNIRPVTTLVEVSALVNPLLLLEVEVTAVIGS